MEKFSQSGPSCVIGWNTRGKLENVSDVTFEDAYKHIHLNVPVPEVCIPKQFPVKIPFTKKQQLQLMDCYPSQPGIFAGVIGAAKMNVDLTNIDFILGGSAMCMLASEHINRSERFISERTNWGAIHIQKRKRYMQNWMQTGFVFERVMTGRDANGHHSGISTESVHVCKIGKFNVLFVAECDACMDDKLVEFKSGDSALKNISKTVLQMLSSNSSVLIVGGIEKKNQLQITSTNTFSLEKLIEENKEKLDENMNCILKNLEILHEMQGCKEIRFNDGLTLNESDECIIPDHSILQRIHDSINAHA